MSDQAWNLFWTPSLTPDQLAMIQQYGFYF